MPVVAARLRNVCEVIVLTACGALLALSLAGGVSARADSINIFAPYWLVCAVIALLLVAWLGRRRRDRTVVRVALGLVSAFGLLAAFLLSPVASAPHEASSARSFRLVSFNMFKANPDPQAVARWLLSRNADFVVLLEVSRANRVVLDKMRERFPFVYDCAEAAGCSTYILSRNPAEDVWPLARGDADNRKALSAVTARFRVEGMLLPITAAHLDRPWPLGEQHHKIQALTNALASVGRDGILAGDLNSAPWTFTIQRLTAAAELRLASGANGTWPATAAPVLRLPLDQLYVGKCHSVVAIQKGPSLGSDHLPLVADIATTRCRG